MRNMHAVLPYVYQSPSRDLAGGRRTMMLVAAAAVMVAIPSRVGSTHGLGWMEYFLLLVR